MSLPHFSPQICQVYHRQPAPDRYDPWRRLLAAVTLRSVLDVCQPTARLAPRDQASAAQFLTDREVQAFLSDMEVSVPWPQIEALMKAS